MYVSKSDWESGIAVVMPDSASRYVIGATKKLKGVYCVNTGYTIFCPVEIIDENNEYYIVKQNLTHGISVYDRIILDAYKSLITAVTTFCKVRPWNFVEFIFCNC